VHRENIEDITSVGGASSKVSMNYKGKTICRGGWVWEEGNKLESPDTVNSKSPKEIRRLCGKGWGGEESEPGVVVRGGVG